MSVKSMTSGRPARLIFSIAVPLMLGNVFQQLYTLVDASIVGKGIGVSALAALGASDWFTWMFIGMAGGFAQGCAIPMAQAFGAEDTDGLRKYLGNSIVLAVVCGAVLTAAALLLIHPVLHLLGTPEDIRPMSVAYLSTLFAGLPVVVAYNLLGSVLRALGDAKSPLYAMIVASIVNIALDALFVLGFGWGVVSAALATIIAQITSCLYCLIRLHRISFLKLSRSDLKPDWQRCVRLLKLGLPLSAHMLMVSIGGMTLQSVVNSQGVAFIAGFTATNKLIVVLESAGAAFGSAMTTYMGQNVGAGRVERVRRGMRAGIATGLITSAAIALIIILFARPMASLFIDMKSPDAAEALRISCEFLRTLSVFMPVLYMLHIVRHAIQGMGNGVIPMLSGVAEFVMRAGMALTLPALIGYRGVFMAEIMAWVGADLILIPGYFRVFGRVKKQYESSPGSADPGY